MSESTERTAAPRFVGTLRLRPQAPPALAHPPTSVVSLPAPPALHERAARRTPPPATDARIEQRIADLALCRDRFPVLFDMAHPQPLAIGVDKQLAELIGADRAGFLLAWWTEWPPYIASVAAGGRRFHLDGTDVGEVSEEHRRTAAGKQRVPEAGP